MPRLGHQPRARLSKDCGTPQAICPRRGSRGSGTHPNYHPHVFIVRGRWVLARVNYFFGTGYNGRRIQHVMALNGWRLPQRTRHRRGRAHTGVVQRPASNERRCSDAFEIACWNGKYAYLGFAFDCFDGECLAQVAAARDLRGADIQQLIWSAVIGRFEAAAPYPFPSLSDTGRIHTALDTLITAARRHLVPNTSPTASPQPNSMP